MNAQKAALATRRKMLVALGLTPAAFAAIRASAGEPAVLPATRPYSGRLTGAKAPDKYSFVSGRLWRTFELAVASYRKIPADDTGVSIGAGVFAMAVELSGEKIEMNIEKFSAPDYSDKKTEECAAAVGLFAAAVAAQREVQEITPEIYKAAFAFAKDQLKPTMIAAARGGPVTRGLAC